METQVRIVTAVASLIEPGKKYLLEIDRGSLSLHDAKAVMDQIDKWGAESVVVMYDGKPLKITEVK